MFAGLSSSFAYLLTCIPFGLCSVMKENHFLNLTEHVCSDQALWGLRSMDHFLTITTNFVRWWLFPRFLVCVVCLLVSYGQLKLFTFHGQDLFPFDDWWVVPAKVVFDQTVWAAVWNSIYFVVLGLLRFESIDNISSALKATFWPMLTVRNSSTSSYHLHHSCCFLVRTYSHDN